MILGTWESWSLFNRDVFCDALCVANTDDETGRNSRELNQESWRTMDLGLISRGQNCGLIKDHFLSFRVGGPDKVSELLWVPDCSNLSLTHTA